MNCDKARTYLSEYLEKRCPSDVLVELDAHFRECASCSDHFWQAQRDANLADAVVEAAYSMDALQARLDTVFRQKGRGNVRNFIFAVVAAMALLVPTLVLLAGRLEPTATVRYQSGTTWSGGIGRIPSRGEFGVVAIRQRGRTTAVGIVSPNGSLESHPVSSGPSASEWQWAEGINGAGDFDRLRASVMKSCGVPRALLICDGPDSPLRRDAAQMHSQVSLLAVLGSTYDWSQRLQRRGVREVNIRQTAPESLSELENYNLVIVNAANRSVNPSFATLLERYVARGGGVVLIGGTPTSLCTPADGPSGSIQGGPTANTDLSSIEKWFGAYRYGNHEGGSAEVLISRPFGVGKRWGTSFHKPGAATVFIRGNDGSLIPIVRWLAGGLFAFAHTYGLGRVYYQSVDREGRRGEQQAEYMESLFVGGCLWAAGFIENPSPDEWH
jgi:hypothetical protein